MFRTLTALAVTATLLSITAVGIASPRAQGHAMMSTEMPNMKARSCPCPLRQVRLLTGRWHTLCCSGALAHACALCRLAKLVNLCVRGRSRPQSAAQEFS